MSPSRPRRCCCHTLPNPTGRNATAEDGFRRNSGYLPASMAVECGKCRPFRSSFMQTAAACGRIGQVCREIGGGHTLVNRPPRRSRSRHNFA
jgi:hypothetical protein